MCTVIYVRGETEAAGLHWLTPDGIAIAHDIMGPVLEDLNAVVFDIISTRTHTHIAAIHMVIKNAPN